MDAEMMIKIWASKKIDVPVERIESVWFDHQEGFCNESGTWWPEENTATVQYWFEGKKGRKHNRKREIYMPEGVEGFQKLLQAILDANKEET
jgi:hypothetical protein